ncbi:nitroreductase/quinone reductase family protein [Streptomyces bacillaris]|uniref:nitroreductase/quinone reductase family protein n=1 Tax=Streptomyces bacillaris TaxID=68179 RepID=UPI003EB9A3C3
MTTGRNSGRRAPVPYSGWRRCLAGVPVALHRVGLGSVLGRRLLLLHHTDRSSGRTRHTALKAIRYDAQLGRWILAGTPEAAWYRDLQAAPLTTIQVRNRYYAVTARLLGDEAEEAGAGTEESDAGLSHRRAGHRLAFVHLDAAPGQHLP